MLVDIDDHDTATVFYTCMDICRHLVELRLVQGMLSY